jgi:hypothetical protein
VAEESLVECVRSSDSYTPATLNTPSYDVITIYGIGLKLPAP